METLALHPSSVFSVLPPTACSPAMEILDSSPCPRASLQTAPRHTTYNYNYEDMPQRPLCLVKGTHNRRTSDLITHSYHLFRFCSRTFAVVICLSPLFACVGVCGISLPSFQSVLTIPPSRDLYLETTLWCVPCVQVSSLQGYSVVTRVQTRAVKHNDF